MKKIACFCIPAHGHTNPMLPVAAELVRRGNLVRFYSFHEFEEKIRATGAEFISCDSYLPPLSKEEEAGLKTVSTTEMTVQDIRITLSMDSFLEEEFQRFAPDVVFTDAVCFWGKLNAWKHQVPMVVSTSTFAFNQLSSRYMKHSPGELADMVFGLPRVSKALKTLEPYGYPVKSALSLVSNDNQTDTVVYTSSRFQPYAESFSDHYLFVGPSVFSKAVPCKNPDRPLVYISMGTVLNDRAEFYKKCMEALKGEDVEVIISCGHSVDREALGALPDNVQVFPYVDQPELLSRTSVFLTHCGMNSVSESLYMATPMLLYPQTGEQRAVARRVEELHAGRLLTDDSAAGIRAAVRAILDGSAYREAAEACSADFRSCPGTAGAAEFIENAPHTSNGIDLVADMNRTGKRFQLFYWLLVLLVINLTGFLVGWKFVWILGVAAGIFSTPLSNAVQKRKYTSLIKKIRK